MMNQVNSPDDFRPNLCTVLDMRDTGAGNCSGHWPTQAFIGPETKDSVNPILSCSRFQAHSQSSKIVSAGLKDLEYAYIGWKA